MGRYLRPIIGVLSIPLLTYGTYTYALDAQRGIRHEFTGRRAGVKQLLAAAGEALGPTPTLVVGGLLTAAAIAWLVVSIRNEHRS